jgi:hypothetical protein
MCVPVDDDRPLALTVGCTFGFETPQPVSAVLQVAPSGRDLQVRAEHWETGADHHGYIDLFGNRCERVTIAAGASRVVYEAEVLLSSSLVAFAALPARPLVGFLGHVHLQAALISSLRMERRAHRLAQRGTCVSTHPLACDAPYARAATGSHDEATGVPFVSPGDPGLGYWTGTPITSGTAACRRPRPTTEECWPPWFTAHAAHPAACTRWSTNAAAATGACWTPSTKRRPWTRWTSPCSLRPKRG